METERSQAGLACLLRFRAMQMGTREDPNAVKQNERLYFQVRTPPPAPEFNENTLLVRLGENATESGQLSTSYELGAKVKDHYFGAMGSNFDPLRPRDITELSKDEKWARSFSLSWRRLNANPLAIPFLTLDTFYFEKTGFRDVKNRFAIFRISYRDAKDSRSVWESRKHGHVIEMKLSGEGRPIETSLLKREPNQPPLQVKDDMGELIYRTKTKWVELKPGLEFSDRKPVWVPRRIDMQHLPNKSYGQDSFKAIEIIIVWSLLARLGVPPDVLGA